VVILVVGAGSIGRRHAANLEALGAAVELIPWRAFDRAALDRRGDVDGMVIATATDVRLPLAELAGAKRWPVYVEKPLAFRAADVLAIHKALAPVAERSVLGFMMRYHPALRALAEADWSDAYGFHFEIGHDVRQWRKNWRFADSYAARAEGGGVLLDLCHEIDMAACLFPGLLVLGCESLGHAKFPGVDFATRVTLGREGGPVGMVAMDYLSPVSLRRGAVRGLGVVADVDFLGPRAETGGVVQTFDFERNDMFLGLMRDFLALVAGRETSGHPLMPRLDRMRGVADLVAAAWEARAFRGAVRVEMG
jgi:predicted dehydrogenase